MKGLRQDRYGWRAYVKVGSLQREKRYPADTPIKTMQAWRDETRVALRKIPQVTTPTETIRLSVRGYLHLEDIKRLASLKSRICELEPWVALYGDIPRAQLTRAQVLAARDRWLADGYAPKTVNHRVRALRHLYHRLDGSKAATPADDIPRLAEPPAAPQFVPVATIRKVAKALTDPKTRARFMVLASTGQRPAQLRRARPEDVNLRTRIWRVRPAKGGQPIPVWLTDDMIVAWKAFKAAQAWGAFDGSTYAKALYVAGWPRDVRPYNAKHTIGITLAESDAEWEDIKDWFGHRDVKTTRIYTGLVRKRLKATGQKLAGRIRWK